MVIERKERGLVTVFDKSVLLHEDFVLFSFPQIPPPSSDHQSGACGGLSYI